MRKKIGKTDLESIPADSGGRMLDDKQGIKPRRRFRFRPFVILTWLCALVSVSLIAGTAVAYRLVTNYTENLPAAYELTIPETMQTTRIFASDGELIAELYEENREYVKYNEIPDNLKMAFIAIEDERFYQHKGIDFEGLGRALYLFVKSGGGKKHGASTITQQLARNMFLAQELHMEKGMQDKLVRKIREIALSLTLEKKYSKEEILENYLNLIYLGHGAHGVKTAAWTYFGKELENLTVAESAMIAALTKAPAHYTPYFKPEPARKRRNTVLMKMREFNFINEDEYRAALDEGFRLSELNGPAYENYKAPYFVTYVLDMLQEQDGPFKFSSGQLYRNGYNIYTTIDMKKQKMAEEAIEYGMGLVEERNANVTQSAIIAVQPQTGDILAMVGGADFNDSKFNRTWQAQRQPGSAFKPFVYMTAIEQGYPLDSTLLDEKTCFEAYREDYCPHNYDKKYKGEINLFDSLKLSRNVPAVKAGHLAGLENVVDMAHRVGISSTIRPEPAIPLGTYELTPLELVTAYSAIANGGYRIRPNAVLKITGPDNEIIYEKRYKTGRKVIGDNVIARIMPALQEVIVSGTGRKAQIERPAAGKTGTTSDYRDAWFAGFTPQIATVVWFGNDDNSPMRNLVKGRPIGWGVAGGSIPAPTWGRFMKAAHEDMDVRDFRLPHATAMAAVRIEIPAASSTVPIASMVPNVVDPIPLNRRCDSPEASPEHCPSRDFISAAPDDGPQLVEN